MTNPEWSLDELKAVVGVLKARFNNLGAEELIDMAAAILWAISKAKAGK